MYRYLNLNEPPDRRRPHRAGRGVLEPYEAYLHERWAQGCRTRSRLFREIRVQGYQHGASTVFCFLQRLAQDPSLATAKPARSPARVSSARHVAYLLVQRPESLLDDERDYLARLGDHEPTLATAYELAQAFAVMVSQRRARITSRPGSPKRPPAASRSSLGSPAALRRIRPRSKPPSRCRGATARPRGRSTS